MIIRILFASCTALMLFSSELTAQNIPVGALPTRYNGGFAGEAGGLRVASASSILFRRYIMSGSNNICSGTFISVDDFLKKLSSGFAFTIGHESETDNYRTTSMSLAVSPKFSFKGKYTFAPFADFSFSYENFNSHSDVFPTDNTRIGHFNIKSGFLVNSQKAYVGIATNVFSRRYTYYDPQIFPSQFPSPTIQYISEMSFSLQAGYSFQRLPESKFSFTPQLLIYYNRFTLENMATQRTEKINDIILGNVNLVFRYKKFLSGINNAGLMLGYQNSRFKLQVTNFYSRLYILDNYRLTREGGTYFFITPIGDPYTYSGNISMRYNFRKDPSAKGQAF